MIYLSLQYRIDDQVAAHLADEGIAHQVICNAREALDQSPQAFERFLARMKSRNLAWTIRQAAIVVDNTLLERWQRQIEEAEEQGAHHIDHYAIPGFVWARFRFPKETLYPCLPVRDPNYGLIYVLQGETYATAAEILLAMKAGAQIEALTSVEFSVVGGDGLPKRFLLPFFSHLIAERARYKAHGSTASRIMEKLTKELVNSAYGKTAQGVNPRRVVQVDNGESEFLGPSRVTESIMASLTTGLARAALSAVLLAIENFNKTRPAYGQISVISCTTDGLLIGLPAQPGYTVVGDYYTSPSHEELAAGALPEFIEKPAPRVQEVLTRFGCGDLLALLEEYLPIRQMRNSRVALTGDDTFLEIKHFADEVYSYKTRGQTGMLSTQHCSFIAKFGQRTPFSDIIAAPEERKHLMADQTLLKKTIEAQWIEDQSHPESGEIRGYNFYTLHSFKDILNGDCEDLVANVPERKFNSDYDCKRRFELADEPEGRPRILPTTRPFETLAQMKKFRGVSQAIRKTGQMATPERVLERIEQQAKASRVRGGTLVTLTRMFLRGVLQGHFSCREPLGAYAEMAAGLNQVWEALGLNATAPKTWTKTDMKNARRGLWEPGLLYPSVPLLELLTPLCAQFGVDLEATRDLLFASEKWLGEGVDLIEEVAKAILLAPRQGIEPFASLYIDGLLPPRQKVLDAFYPHLTEARLSILTRSPFAPGQRPRSDLPRIRRLLNRLVLGLGLGRDTVGACAQALVTAPRREIPERKPRNPKCTELFVQALLQPDIVPFEVDRGRVLHHFAEYRVSASLYSALRQRKFTSRVLSDSPANRLQIRQMAKRLGIDPAPFFKAMLDR